MKPQFHEQLVSSKAIFSKADDLIHEQVVASKAILTTETLICDLIDDQVFRVGYSILSLSHHPIMYNYALFNELD